MAISLRTGVDLRRAAVSDAPALAALLPERPAPRLLADRLEQLLADGSGTALVATDYDGSLIGVIALGWHRTLRDAERAGEITSFVVAETERRRGIGRMLLKAASQAARLAGCDHLDLRLDGDNPAARCFCQQTGFAAGGAVFSRNLRKGRVEA